MNSLTGHLVLQQIITQVIYMQLIIENNYVKVFDNTAKYLFKFRDGKGEGKMSHPKGLLIRDNKVFVSHSHCILVYQLDGKFVSSIGGRRRW